MLTNEISYYLLLKFTPKRIENPLTLTLIRCNTYTYFRCNGRVPATKINFKLTEDVTDTLA